MSRNIEERFQETCQTQNLKMKKTRKIRQSQPLMDDKFIDMLNQPKINSYQTKKNNLFSQLSKNLKPTDLHFLCTPSSYSMKMVKVPSVCQKTQQTYNHYKQPNSNIFKKCEKFLSPKQQINNSIIMIENILKNGVRPSVQEKQKQSSKFFRKDKRFSEEALPSDKLDKEKKQYKKQPFFLQKLQKSQNNVTKGSLLETMASEDRKTSLENRIQHFTYIKQLGRGKFGVVSLAMHKKTGFLFAIKAMSKRSIVSENIIEQIIREVKIQHSINHPNIVKLFDIFDDEQHLYLIMEYCNEGQFYHLLSKRGKIPEQETRAYVKQICEGVSQLHKHGIIHRDLKPQNIVLSFNMIKLCDFGWSVASKNSLRQTFCGTPLYVSPQLLGGNSYDQKVDLWAIGIITFEMLTGQNPFKINTQKQLIKIIEQSIVYPQNMSDEAKQFIKLVLQKNPRSRGTIDEVLELDFLKYQKNQTSLNSSRSTKSFNKFSK